MDVRIAADPCPAIIAGAADGTKTVNNHFKVEKHYFSYYGIRAGNAFRKWHDSRSICYNSIGRPCQRIYGPIDIRR